MNTKASNSGNHLIIEAFNCNKEILSNKKTIKNILNELCDKIGMKKITKPVVIAYKSIEKEKEGITGFLIIAESHIAIHTYPQQDYASIDVFSCKEFDDDTVIDYFKTVLNTNHLKTKMLFRGRDTATNFPEIRGPNISARKTVKDLIGEMKNMGLQATNVARGAEIIKEMKDDNATIFLTFTSNMVSSGLREIFAQLAKEKLIDVIITTIGSIEEDFIKSEKPFLLGDFQLNDKQLHQKNINRIGNILVPNDRYEWFEKKIHPILEEMYQEKTIWAPHEITKRLGEKLDDKNSFLYWCARNDIPIFCQAVTDGAFGLQLYFFKQQHNDFIVDETKEKKLAEIVLNAEKTGGIILGGGVAKHHAIGVNILRNGFDYLLYITTASPYDGSLSGARPKEAKSWGKLKEGADKVCIQGDASIVFPLIVSAWLDE